MRPLYVVLGAIVVVLVAVAAGLVVVAGSGASLVADSSALAKVQMPVGGGTVTSVSAVTGPHSSPVPIRVSGEHVWPRGRIRAGQIISIDVVVRRPGWIAWLTGHSQRLHLRVRAPVARLQQTYVTVAPRAPLRLRFNRAVSAIAYGPAPGRLHRQYLSSPSSQITLQRTALAGSIWVKGLVRGWEKARPQVVSWFPAGAATTAVANPAPGSTIRPNSQIVLTFSKPVASALGSHRPPVSPATPGAWRELNSHTIAFRPESYGYGLGAKVTVALPSGVRLIGGRPGSSAAVGTWSVPPGSTLRLQQLLGSLGYLPLTFHGQPVAPSLSSQEAAAVNPPKGSFAWRYGNVPSTLRGMWQPGTFGTMTKGAVMRFEDDHGLATDGQPGPAVWKALISAAVSGHGTSFGYNFVMVSEASPEKLTMWHNGRDEFTVPVNTGIPSAPTATGTYPVFEHLRVTTMSGTNPDGSHYSDPGIPYVSYFNGGDALHGFLRSQYGSPQSLGCVEMSYADAARVYPYTPIGTLVSVT